MKQVWTALFLVCVLSSIAFAQDGGSVATAQPAVEAATSVAETPAPSVGVAAVSLPEPRLEVIKPPEAPSGLSQVLTTLIDIIAAALGVLLIWLTKNGISFLEKKTKIDIPQQMEETLAEWAEMGVHYATEKAHQYLKENGEKMKGPDKLDTALSFAMSLAEEHKLSAVAKEKLVKYIEARLGMDRDA